MADKRSKKLDRKTIDMNFIGFTYKGDVEYEKSKLVNVLKDLDSITDTQMEEKDEEAKI